MTSTSVAVPIPESVLPECAFRLRNSLTLANYVFLCGPFFGGYTAQVLQLKVNYRTLFRSPRKSHAPLFSPARVTPTQNLRPSATPMEASYGA